MSASAETTPVDQEPRPPEETRWERLLRLLKTRPDDPSGPVLVFVALVAFGFGLYATSGLWGGMASRVISGNVPDAMHYSWWLGHTPHALALSRRRSRPTT